MFTPGAIEWHAAQAWKAIAPRVPSPALNAFVAGSSDNTAVTATYRRTDLTLGVMRTSGRDSANTSRIVRRCGERCTSTVDPLLHWQVSRCVQVSGIARA